MTEEPDHKEHEAPKGPRVSLWAVVRSVFGAVVTLVMIGGIGAALAVFHPQSPLPPEWNPTADLQVSHPVTPLTGWKLRQAIADPQLCVSVLQTGADARPQTPREDSENCHIRNRVALTQVGAATSISPRVTETSCATALLLAMWERHGIQPAARDILGAEVSTIRQIGSYNCRPINTTNGPSTRWSTHATADAIDVTGFDMTDGSRIRLIDDWDGDTAQARFLRSVRDSSCIWFGTTLGPDYNVLHADHFHLQVRGWGLCR